MRVVRVRVERCGTCQDGDRQLEEHPCGSYAATEGRVVFNRVETLAIRAGLVLRERWSEDVVYRVQRARCVLFGRHSRACHGRADHRAARVAS